MATAAAISEGKAMTGGAWQWQKGEGRFKMPVHYPRYTRAQYECMDETKLDLLLRDYGLKPTGSLAEKREEAMGHFLWS